MHLSLCTLDGYSDTAVWYYFAMAQKAQEKGKKAENPDNVLQGNTRAINGANGEKSAMINQKQSVYRDGKDQRYSDEAYKRFREYQKEWQKEKTVTTHLHFNSERDKEVIEWMKERQNKTDYIRQLILTDMMYCEQRGLKPEDDKYIKNMQRKRKGN